MKLLAEHIKLNFMLLPLGKRRCIKCGHIKPTDAFSKLSRVKSGLCGTCNACISLFCHGGRAKGERRRLNLTGQTFDRLYVVDSAGNNKRGRPQWNCVCTCGKRKVVTTASLRNGRHSCGCYAIETAKRLDNKFRLPAGESQLNGVFSQYRHRARRFKREWGLSKEQFKKILSSNCIYCNALPVRCGENGFLMVRNTVDRVDSKQGYTPENSVPCCLACNKAKMNRSYTEFVEWACRVASHVGGRACQRSVA